MSQAPEATANTAAIGGPTPEGPVRARSMKKPRLMTPRTRCTYDVSGASRLSLLWVNWTIPSRSAGASPASSSAARQASRVRLR